MRATKKEIIEQDYKQAVPLTRRHFRKILKDTRHNNTQQRAAIAVAWATGSRYSDLKKLQHKDITIFDKAIRLRFRGIKGAALGSTTHIRWIPTVGQYRIAKYFLTRQAVDMFTLSRATFTRPMKRINPNYSAHSPRRGAATLLAVMGVSTKKIQQFLGHKSKETTRRYIAPLPQQKESKQAIAMATKLR